MIRCWQCTELITRADHRILILVFVYNISRTHGTEIAVEMVKMEQRSAGDIYRKKSKTNTSTAITRRADQ